MSSERKFTLAHLLMMLIFVAGLTVRLFELGEMPLSDSEAVSALEAYHLFSGTGAELERGGNQGYVSLTGLAMFLFGGTNFIARFVPAIASALLVLVPFWFRNRLGGLTALIFAAGLAFDPLLVNASRLAGGPSLALGLLVIALALLARKSGMERSGRLAFAGVLFGMGIISGTGAFFGGLALLLTYAAYRAFIAGDNVVEQRSVNPFAIDASGRNLGLIALTMLLGSTGFLLSPQGVAGFASSISGFLMRWVEPASVSPSQILIALVGYQFLPLIFAGISAFRTMRDDIRHGKLLLVWLFSSLLLLMIYPGRNVIDLVWVSVPLWGLAAMEIGADRYWKVRPFYYPLLLAGVLLVFLISFWVNATSLTYAIPGDPQLTLRLMILAGTLILGVLSVSLAGLGWGQGAAASGTVWGFGVFILLGLMSGIWGMSHRGSAELREPWLPVPVTGEAALLNETLQSLGNWYNGATDVLDIRYTVDSPALEWALRDYPGAQKNISFGGDELPDVIITTPDQQEVRLSSAYRGQGLSWRIYPDWDSLDRRGWAQWLLFRESGAAVEKIIVWVRADLFFAFGDDDFAELYPLDAIEDGPDEEFVPLEDLEGLFPGE